MEGREEFSQQARFLDSQFPQNGVPFEFPKRIKEWFPVSKKGTWMFGQVSSWDCHLELFTPY